MEHPPKERLPIPEVYSLQGGLPPALQGVYAHLITSPAYYAFWGLYVDYARNHAWFTPREQRLRLWHMLHSVQAVPALPPPFRKNLALRLFALRQREKTNLPQALTQAWQAAQRVAGHLTQQTTQQHPAGGARASSPAGGVRATSPAGASGTGLVFPKRDIYLLQPPPGSHLPGAPPARRPLPHPVASHPAAPHTHPAQVKPPPPPMPLRYSLKG